MKIQEFLSYLDLNKIREIESFIEALPDEKHKAIYNSIYSIVEGKFQKAIEILAKQNWDLQNDQIPDEMLNIQGKTSLANAYQKMGRLREGKVIIDELERFFSNFSKIKDLEYQYWSHIYFKVKGVIDARLGELHRGIDALIISLQAAENCEMSRVIAIAHNNLGYLYTQIGEFQKSKVHFEESLKFSELMSSDTFIYYPLSNMGIYHYNTGNIEVAKQYHERALKVALKLNNRSNIASQYRDLAQIYRSQGKLDKSFELLQKSHHLRLQIGNRIFIAYVLTYLIEVALELSYFEVASSYKKELDEICEDTDNKLILGLGTYSNAIELKYKGRIEQKVAAMENLYQLIDNINVDSDLKINSLLHLCDLLIFELEATGSSDVLIEVTSLTDRLLEAAKKHNSIRVLVETKFLRGNLKIVNSEVEQGLLEISEANELAKANNFQNSVSKINNFLTKFETEVQSWRNKITNNEDLQKRMLRSQISEYIQDVLKVKDNVTQK